MKKVADVIVGGVEHHGDEQTPKTFWKEALGLDAQGLAPDALYHAEHEGAAVQQGQGQEVHDAQDQGDIHHEKQEVHEAGLGFLMGHAGDGHGTAQGILDLHLAPEEVRDALDHEADPKGNLQGRDLGRVQDAELLILLVAVGHHITVVEFESEPTQADQLLVPMESRDRLVLGDAQRQGLAGAGQFQADLPVLVLFGLGKKLGEISALLQELAANARGTDVADLQAGLLSGVLGITFWTMRRWGAGPGLMPTPIR